MGLFLTSFYRLSHSGFRSRKQQMGKAWECLIGRWSSVRSVFIEELLSNFCSSPLSSSGGTLQMWPVCSALLRTWRVTTASQQRRTHGNLLSLGNSIYKRTSNTKTDWEINIFSEKLFLLKTKLKVFFLLLVIKGREAFRKPIWVWYSPLKKKWWSH